MAQIGRPTLLTPEVAKKICTEISKGRTLLDVCEDEGMPDRTTVHLWLLEANKESAKPILKEFLVNYAQAREIQLETMLDDVIKDASADNLDITVNKDGKVVVNGEAVQRSRLKVDTKIRYIEKIAPKKYGVVRQESRIVDENGKDREFSLIAGIIGKIQDGNE